MALAAEMVMRRAAITMPITMDSQHQMVLDQLNLFYMTASQPFHKLKVHSIHRRSFHHLVSVVRRMKLLVCLHIEALFD